MKFLRNLWTWLTVDLLKILLDTQEKVAKLEAQELQYLAPQLEDIEEKLNYILWKSKGKTLVIRINQTTIQTPGDIKMAFNLKDTQEVVLTATVLDSKGNPASISGTPTWSISDADVASLKVAEGNLSATVTAGTKFATTTVTFTVDGVTATFDVTLVGGAAASATLVAGTPSDIPTPVVDQPADPVPAEPAAQPAQ